MTYISKKYKTNKFWPIFIIILVACFACNSEPPSPINIIKEGIVVKIIYSVGDQYDNKFLPLLGNIGKVNAVADIEVLVLSLKLDKNSIYNVDPIAMLKYQEGEKEKQLIVAVPTIQELQTLEIHERVVRETDMGIATADLVISSAMDLQMKLANDGYAKRVNFTEIANWPNWAKWRNTAFALTYEPAVMIYHKPSFDGIEIPKTRAALSQFLSNNNNTFYGRIATYDIERAGLGFLFLARDEEHYRDIWQLVQAMGSSGVKLYSKS